MDKRETVPQRVEIREAGKRWRQLLDRVHRQGERLIIEREGVPLAALIGIEDYERYRRLLAQEHLRQLGPALGRAARRQGLDEGTLIDELAADRRAVYEELYGERGVETD